MGGEKEGGLETNWVVKIKRQPGEGETTAEVAAGGQCYALHHPGKGRKKKEKAGLPTVERKGEREKVQCIRNTPLTLDGLGRIRRWRERDQEGKGGRGEFKPSLPWLRGDQILKVNVGKAGIKVRITGGTKRRGKEGRRRGKKEAKIEMCGMN